jgi:hypothetical protein
VTTGSFRCVLATDSPLKDNIMKFSTYALNNGASKLGLSGTSFSQTMNNYSKSQEQDKKNWLIQHNLYDLNRLTCRALREFSKEA